jgi:hypothetical protein
MAYLERFPTWSEILKPPEQVQGQTMRGLIDAVAQGRRVNDTKARRLRWAFVLLVLGVIQAATAAFILTARHQIDDRGNNAFIGPFAGARATGPAPGRISVRTTANGAGKEGLLRRPVNRAP